jgi:Predicted ribosomal protein
MIKVELVMDSSNAVSSFKMAGHAGAAPHGEDIVCAAVSAIVYTTLGSLEDLCGITSYTIDEGFVEWHMPEGVSEEVKRTADIILKTMIIGLKQIRYTPSYKKYISIVERGGALE